MSVGPVFDLGVRMFTCTPGKHFWPTSLLVLVGSRGWGKEEVHQFVTWRTNVKNKSWAAYDVTLFQGCHKKGVIRGGRGL